MAPPDIASAFIDRPIETGFSVAPWGERARPRVSVRHTGSRVSIVELSCPPGFGPPRHIHREDDEILVLQQGRMVVWLESGSQVAEPGDIIFIPPGTPHTWHAVDAVAMLVVTTPGQFEPWLELVVERSLQLEDVGGITKAASDAGMDLTGPPLTKDEVEAALGAA